MNEAQNLSFHNALSPQSLNGAAGTTTTKDVSAYRYATVVVKFGAVGAAATVLKLTESDDDSSYSDITGAVSSGSTGNGRLPQTGDANKYFIFYVRLGGARKKYLKPEFTAGASATLVSIDVILSDALISPDTIAERGVTSQVFVNS